MANLDLETFHLNKKQAMENSSAFVGSKRLKELIISCRLKPYTSFTVKFKNRKLQKHWVDEFGNSIYLSNGKVKTAIKDRKIKKNTNTSSDLFFLRPMVEILDLSQAIVFCPNHILFYGKDEYFRCYSYDGERASPLSVGAEEIMLLLANIDMMFKKIGNDFVIYQLPNNEIKIMIQKEYSK